MCVNEWRRESIAALGMRAPPPYGLSLANPTSENTSSTHFVNREWEEKPWLINTAAEQAGVPAAEQAGVPAASEGGAGETAATARGRWGEAGGDPSDTTGGGASGGAGGGGGG